MNSKSIFKSNRVIGFDCEPKRAKVQILTSTAESEDSHENKENNEAFDDHWLHSFPKKSEQQPPSVLKKTFRSKYASGKLIKSRSCLKHSSTGDEDEHKSVKSIKFKQKADKLEYSLPSLPPLKKSHSRARLAPLKKGAKVQPECCQIY